MKASWFDSGPNVSGRERRTGAGGYGWGGTVGVHGPSIANASVSPGQGGVVNPMATSGSSLVERNWNLVPTGIVIDTPGPTSTVSWRPSAPRHIRPAPAMKYQISEIVLC